MKKQKLKPKAPKPKSNQFMQSDKEMNANEKKAGYDNEGAFGMESSRSFGRSLRCKRTT